MGFPPDVTGSRRTLLLLVVMVGAMWFWKSSNDGSSESPLPYSQLFAWTQQGKVGSVVISGDTLDGTLKTAETLDGRTVKDFHCNLPASDPALLPLLRE